jgi:hypothetical protein
MKRFLLIAMFVCSLPMHAQDEVSFFAKPLDDVNRELPYWLRFSGEERLRMEGFENGAFKPNAGDLYLLQRVRFNMKIQPVWWVKVFVQSQDSREFFKNQVPAPPYQSTWDLRQAYGELGDMEKGFFALRVGRQEINLGEERLVGSSNWTNTARTFDAARLTLHYKKVRLDAFASSVVVLQDGQVGSVTPGNNIHGLYGGLQDVLPHSKIEPYFFWRLQPNVKSELGPTGNSDMKVTGVRWLGTLPYGFDYNTDVAFERGFLRNDSINAWACHFVFGHTVKPLAWTPRFWLEYNYATGDGNAKDGQRNTFDQLYSTAHDKYGLSDQVGWKNIHHTRTGAEWKMPWKMLPKWQMSVRYSDYWLADAHDALYNTSNSVVAKSASGSAGRWVGQGLDFVNMVQISKITQLGGGVAHIFPGTFLKIATPGQSYTSPYLFFQTQF